MNETKYMAEAIRLSIENVQSSIGGPFGAVIVKDDRIIATGNNQVTSSNDPTAHAEIVAIRSASKTLNTFDLSGCEIYTSCEPCPMCLSAIYWAKINTVYYANTKEDAANIGFNDQFIYEELEKPKANRSIKMKQMLRDEANEAFMIWNNLDEKIEY
ncbi:MAG: nucleoside deaminase [Bacteroidota bacterium]